VVWMLKGLIVDLDMFSSPAEYRFPRKIFYTAHFNNKNKKCSKKGFVGSG
jgi:hypothetical protein